MRRWLVTMGDFHSASGQLLDVTWNGEGLRYSVRCEFVPPQELRVVGKGFTGAKILGDSIYVAGFNAVYRGSVHDSHVSLWIARADFNDLHDVDLVAQNGRIERVYVANTGRDCIDTLDADGQLLQRLPLVAADGAVKTAASSAYFADSDRSAPFHRRKIPTCVHPNSVRWIDGRLWYARFADRAIVVMDREHEWRASTAGCPHDLVPFGRDIWFTTTDGRIWRLPSDLSAGTPSLVHDTFALTGFSGWCRGLAIDEEFVLVGLTRVARRVVDRWSDRPHEGTTTRLLLFHRRTEQLMGSLVLDTLGCHPKVFSILSMPSREARQPKKEVCTS